jgi:hypothetical protein
MLKTARNLYPSVLNYFCHWNFENLDIVSNFDIQISDLNWSPNDQYVDLKPISLRETGLMELVIFQAFNNCGGEQRKHNLMMTHKGVSLTTLQRGSLNHVGHGSIVLHEIHIDGGKFLDLMSKVPHQ